MASVDGAQRPLRFFLEAAQPLAARDAERLVAAALDFPGGRVRELFPRLAPSNEGLARFLVLELPLTRRAGRAVRHRIADRLRRRAGFLRALPERLGLRLESFGHDPNDVGYPRDTHWHLSAPVNRGQREYWGYTGAVDVFGAWHELPGNDPLAYGAGVRIGHPDSGFRVHTLVPVGRIDLELAFNAFDEVKSPLGTPPGQNVAVHPLEPRGFPYFPTHGTQTAAVVVAPPDPGWIFDNEVYRAPLGDNNEPTSELRSLGVAPGATMVPLRCTDSVVMAGDVEIGRAIEYAVEADVDVLLIALGGSPFPGLQPMIAAALEAGIVVVAAAGQIFKSAATGAANAVVAPAAYPECIAVAGNRLGKPWELSNRGPEVDVCAPAWGVWTGDFNTQGGERTRGLGGTSFSTSIVAGVAALWIGHHGRDALRARYPGAALQAAFRYLLRTTAYDPTRSTTPIRSSR